MVKPRQPGTARRHVSRAVLCGACLLTACTTPGPFRGHFGIILADGVPITTAATPAAVDIVPASNESVRDHATSSNGGGNGTPAVPPPPPSGGSGGGGSGGGGSGGGAAGPPAGLQVTTAQRFAIQDAAGTPAAGMALGTDALSAEFEAIAGIVTAPDGTAYVCDQAANQIRAIPPAGPTSIVAGTSDGSAGFLGENIPAVGATLSAPVGLVRDDFSGALLFADSGNGRIRYFVPGGRIYTLVGGGQDPSDQVVQGSRAQLQQPFGIAADATGKTYFTERSTGRIRTYDASGTLNTLTRITAGQVGPIAVSPDGQHLWVGVDGAVEMLPTSGAAATTEVYRATTGVITGLAFDRALTLYVAETAGTPVGSLGTRVTALTVDGGGRAIASIPADVVAGTGGQGQAPLDYAVPPAGRPDARAQLLAGGGFCSLYIDLYTASDPNLQGGTLYLGNVMPGPGGWSQLIRLAPS